MKAQLGAPSNSRTLQQPPHLLQQQRVCSSRRSAPHRQRAFHDRQTAVDSLEDLEIAVPVDQRPVNELSALKEAFLYKDVRHKQAGTYVLLHGVLAPHTVLAPLQATLPLNAYLGKLGLVFGVTFAIVAAPIANQTFPFSKEVRGQCWLVCEARNRQLLSQCKQQTADSTSSPSSISISSWKLVGPPPIPTYTQAALYHSLLACAAACPVPACSSPPTCSRWSSC